MKKLLFILMVGFISTTLMAQESAKGKAGDEKEALEAPKDIKVKEFNDFKNSSFNIYEKSEHYKKVLKKDEKLSASDVTEAKKLKEDVTTLLTKTDDMLDKAKNIKPKTKSPSAVNNTQKSIKALNIAKENLEFVFTEIKD